jgi:hypothetical protein
MDASEHDLDAKLYKASSTLLSELQHKLPLLLHKPGTPQAYRLRVLDTKCAELNLLVRLSHVSHGCRQLMLC